MKTKLNFSVILMLFLTILSYAQNRSNGTISFTTPIGALPPNNPVEAFRFRSGLVTQLDLGTTFDLSGIPAATTQWFSLGRLTAPSQTLYGLRVQRAGRGLVMGYSGAVESTTATVATTAGNPFIQWVGSDINSITPGDLEFRASTSSNNPLSDKLVMTLRADATTLFGQFSALFGTGFVTTPLSYKGIEGVAAPTDPVYVNPKVEINSLNRPALSVSNLTTTPPNFRLINSNVAGLFNQIITTTGDSYGIISNSTSSASGDNYSIRATALGGINNYGIYSSVTSSTGVGAINCGIYATATGTQSTVTGPLGNYAGYFAGTVYATQGLYGSDARLKKDIKTEVSSLEKLNALNPVTYNFEQKQDGLRLNLPEGLQHGFIAQELEKVYPELVTDVLHPIFNDKNEQTGTKTLKAVNYIGLISVLTESIKELSNEVTVLKEKIAKSDRTYVINNNKNFTEEELKTIKNNGFYLGQNTPNPFKTSSVIEYSLPENEREASLLILNLNGQTIKEYKLNEVKGSVSIDAGILQKGMYLYSLISNGEEIATKKMIVN